MKKTTKKEILDFANAEIELQTKRAKQYRKQYLATCLLLGEMVAAENFARLEEQLEELELTDEEVEL